MTVVRRRLGGRGVRMQGTMASPVGRAKLREFRRAFTGLRREESIAGYLFLLPNLVGFIVFMLFPILFAFYIMLTDWSLAKPPEFIGLKNFDTMVNDQAVSGSRSSTASITPSSPCPRAFSSPSGWRWRLNRKMRGIIFFRTVYFLPQITLTVAAATDLALDLPARDRDD